jgi:hypothetical protein
MRWAIHVVCMGQIVSHAIVCKNPVKLDNLEEGDSEMELPEMRHGGVH